MPKPRCKNGSRRKPRKTGKCVKTKRVSKIVSNKVSSDGRSTRRVKRSFLKGLAQKTKSQSKTLSLPDSKSKSKSKSKTKSKTKKKSNYRSFLKCELRRLKKENPNVRQQSIMKMAAKNWNKGKMTGGSKGG